MFYFQLAERPGAAREKKILTNFFKKIIFIFLAYNPWVSTKSFIPFGSAVWPAIRNICTSVLFYYLEIAVSLNNWQAHIRIKQFLSQSPHLWSYSGFKSTVVNRTLPSLHGGPISPLKQGVGGGYIYINNINISTIQIYQQYKYINNIKEINKIKQKITGRYMDRRK